MEWNWSSYEVRGDLKERHWKHITKWNEECEGDENEREMGRKYPDLDRTRECQRHTMK